MTLTSSYLVQKVALGCVYLVFSGLTATYILVSSRAGVSAPWLDGLATWAFPASISMTLLILVLGIGHAAYGRRLRLLTAWAVVAAAALPVLVVFDNYAMECDVHREIRRRIPLELSAREQATLRTPESVCPTFYSYQRDSDGQHAVVTGAADFVHGPEVWFGTQ